MGAIKSFEDIAAWQRAREFSQRVFRCTIKGNFYKDFGLRNQLNDATGSIMDNIAEGFERGGTKEFITFLSYAKGSTGESRSQLYRAFDRGYISENELKELSQESETIGRMIGAFMSYLKSTPIRGAKFNIKPPATSAPDSNPETPNPKL